MAKITEAPYCRQDSQTAGTNEAQYRAGLRLVELAIEADANVEFMLIEATKSEDYFPWIRLKGKKGSIRTIVEIIDSSEVIVHIILPRDSHTYDEVESLWKKHHRKR